MPVGSAAQAADISKSTFPAHIFAGVINIAFIYHFLEKVVESGHIPYKYGQPGIIKIDRYRVSGRATKG